jgi:hypothetical protein
MLTKILRNLGDYLFRLAGVPTGSPPEAAPDGNKLISTLADGKVVQMVPVKNFLHYL